MYTHTNAPKSFQDYDKIARLERSKAFHAGIAWIVSLLRIRKAHGGRTALQAC